ncbi:uncharacterized protein LOC133420457 [Cololabis saira]|uniref:uncharacterized protein LOC133420457 n=1 Tax=Cololabis saira TaxID=129043 RepID=UPI002AD254C8|nr:uncharacterized protein LOC133420457 [Cololabis saira]
MNFTLTLAVLCTLSWIRVSVSEFFTVEVHPGEEVTLRCFNFSIDPIHIFWFKLDNKLKISKISSMPGSEGNSTLYDGFKDGRFNMTSNITIIFLNIKLVDFNDSGLYFCGFNQNNHILIYSATSLQVDGKTANDFCVNSDTSTRETSLPSWILGGVILVLVVIIVFLVVKIHSLKTAPDEEQNPHHSQELDVNYARLSFRPKARKSQNLPPERETEPNVVYAATR